MMKYRRKAIIGIVICIFFTLNFMMFSASVDHPTSRDPAVCEMFSGAKIKFNPGLRVGRNCSNQCLFDRFNGLVTEDTLANNGHEVIKGNSYVFRLRQHSNSGAIDAGDFTKVTAEFGQFFDPDTNNENIETNNAFYVSGTEMWVTAGEYSFRDHINLAITFWIDHGLLMARLHSKFIAIRRNDGRKTRVDLDISCPVKFPSLARPR